MYRPDRSAIDDPAVLRAAMDQITLGALITASDDGFHTTHLPWLVREEAGVTVLEGHFARGNPHWRKAGKGPSMVLFQGPSAYISPSFYPSKAEHGKAVPTWAYIAVEAQGRFETITDGDWLHAHVSALSDRHEAGRAQPWAVSDAPVAYLAALKRGIVGVRFTVETLEGKWKVNQTKPEADRAGTVEGLRADGGDAAADIAAALATFPDPSDH